MRSAEFFNPPTGVFELIGLRTRLNCSNKISKSLLDWIIPTLLSIGEKNMMDLVPRFHGMNFSRSLLSKD